MSTTSNRWDNMKLGITIGAIAPFLGVFLYYYVHQALPSERISGMTYDEYLNMLKTPKVLATVLRGSLLMNLGAFFLALNFELTNVSKGIIGMTFFYGLLIVYLHFA
ncbi:MAG: hypothetical protein R2730_10510 [Chitinophagales bacterium]